MAPGQQNDGDAPAGLLLPPSGRHAGRFPLSGGIMADRIRRHDWSASPLGPIDTWSLALQMAVETMLASRFPQCLVWGPDRITIHNDAFVPILGAKPDALGRPLHEIWSEAWDAVSEIADRAYAGEATFIEDFEVVIARHGQPERAFFTFCYSPVRDTDGCVVGMLDTVVETTAKVLAERDLRAERHRQDLLNATLERQVAESTANRNRLWLLSTDIMVVVRFDGTITTVNPAWYAVLGWSEAELIGQSVFALTHPDDLERTANAARQLSEGVTVSHFENRFRHKDGSYRSIVWTAVPGEGLMHAVGRDCTAERAHAEALGLAEEALRQSQKMEAVGQLTGGMAHDFNNLLAGIGGALELMETRLRQNRTAELPRYIASARDAAGRAAALTHRLLAFSRRQTLDPRPTQANRLVAGMEDLIRRTAGPHITLETAPAGGLWQTLCDPNQLENALLNLAINARDAMPEGGRLTIETGNASLDQRSATAHGMAAGDYVVISVADTGTGMAPDIRARAFDPFFTTKPLGAGTGLGLSMIYGFARQSGGQAHIWSELGRGTIVRIYLPRHDGVPEEEPAPPRADGPPVVARGETVLVVDDEANVRMLVAEVLEEHGYTALQAVDGASGLAVLQSDARIDLLVSDVGLPGGMNGRQMADTARLARPDLKVLFITGYAEQTVLDGGHLQAGMHVLTKPFALDVLTARVGALIAAE